jgi:8-oxo-dGTP pyrophosphatase MutT (NUDIX family)
MEKKNLYDNKWISLYSLDGYVCMTETRCNGKIVSVLPYRKILIDDRVDIEFLLRKEVTLPWRGTQQVISSITGGIESEDHVDDAVRELHEEGGYLIPKEEMIYLGQTFGAKCADTVYHYYTCDLTDYVREESKGDGSKLESMAVCEWFKNVDSAEDPLVYKSFYEIFKILHAQQGYSTELHIKDL